MQNKTKNSNFIDAWVYLQILKLKQTLLYKDFMQITWQI